MYACAWGTDYEVVWCPASHDHKHTDKPKGGKGTSKDTEDDDQEQLQGAVAALDAAAPPPPC